MEENCTQRKKKNGRKLKRKKMEENCTRNERKWKKTTRGLSERNKTVLRTKENCTRNEIKFYTQTKEKENFGTKEKGRKLYSDERKL
ncbi:hypothetical protein CEXT_482731 [Caerostris extrusa]|uniref:Uncharacterized protein n=1 Tax=Caerostris extrusa TaxID=172846 RepID=A0AAV4NMH9_CAEEX|nr:hypothetical protein CEXT_482731 [Caerostris extrusa]